MNELENILDELFKQGQKFEYDLNNISFGSAMNAMKVKNAIVRDSAQKVEELLGVSK